MDADMLPSTTSDVVCSSLSKSSFRKPDFPSPRTGRVSFESCRPGQSPHEAQACHRKGNEVAVKKVVDGLYQRVLSDDTLKPFFSQGTDMVHVVEMQQVLMKYVFGGQEMLQLDNPGFDLRANHMRSLVAGGLSSQHWEAFVQHFQDTLDALPEIPAETRASATAWMRSTKDAFRAPSAEEVEAYRQAHPGVGKCPFH